MEVKLYFKNGSIESHEMPAYNGRTITSSEGNASRTDVTMSDLDLVGDVVERFEINENGVYLVRRVLLNETASEFVKSSTTPVGTSHTVRVLSARRMGELERISVDGEVVWPEDVAGVEGEIGRLEDMVRQLS